MLSSQWLAHRGAVTCLTWAHPEFGSLLATCGNDYDAKIWEERTSSQHGSSTTPSASTAFGYGSSPGGGIGMYLPMQGLQAGITGGGNASTTASVTPPPASSSSSASSSRWIAKAALTEARRAVTCCEFAPRHWGLKLAVGSADGCVRLYEVLDFQNLEQWPLRATLEPFHREGGSSPSSSTSGNPGSGTGRNTSRDANPANHRAGGGAAGSVDSGSTGGGGHFQVGCTCLSWCNSRFEPPTLVVGGKHLVVYVYSDAARAWQALMTLPGPTSIRNNPQHQPSVGGGGGAGIVLDVAWAPNVGRRFHWIAAAEEDQVRIYKLNRESSANRAPASSPPGRANDKSAAGTNRPRPHLSLVSDIPIRANAWRCQWNVTGTVLAVSGDGGVVRLFRARSTAAAADGGTDSFVCVSTIPSNLGKVFEKHEA